MNRQEIITAIANDSGLTKRDTDIFMNSFINVVSEALATGESVNIMGFGKFEVRERAAREGVNPRTGDKITINASKTPAFKAGKSLKDRVNEVNI